MLNTSSSSGGRRLLASTTPQMLTVYYDLAGVPSGQASSAQNTLSGSNAALVAALNQEGAAFCCCSLARFQPVVRPAARCALLPCPGDNNIGFELHRNSITHASGGAY